MTRIPKNTEYKVYDSIKKEWYCPDHDQDPIFVKNVKLDWNRLIKSVENKVGKRLPNLIWDNPHFEEMKKLYIDSNYVIEASEWINYYPREDFDLGFVQDFGKQLGHTSFARAWISRINPGKTAPWHWDLDDEEAEYLSKGQIIRYVCKMNQPSPGQVTIIGNHALHGGSQGDTYQWPDHRMWHGSVNCGLEPKYQFNYLGYKND